MNVNLFAEQYPNYKISKPIRLIELFAGIGAQHQALKNLKANFTSHRIVEWQVHSIQAYNDIHIRDYIPYSSEHTKENLIEALVLKGVSLDYNKPATAEQLQRKPIEWLRKVYDNIIATKNLVNICNVSGRSLGITETDKYEYILTYSFPCQDLSLAGKRAGLTKDSGTRSGLLWEIERIFNEIKKEGGELPQVLLMENVTDLVETRFFDEFLKWEEYLSSLGYFNYYKVLNAKNYGVPQNRERVFMVSILGGYTYEFPKGKKLKLRLKDMLEEKVDEKYYLSNDLTSFFINNHIKQNHNASAVVVRDVILIPEDTKKGYAEAKDGDGVYINRPQQKRGVVQNGMIQTIKADSNDIGVVVKTNNLCIRKLTPLECYRLMGFSDEAFYRTRENQSDTTLYHQAGDSIVVNVLEAIIKELL